MTDCWGELGLEPGADEKEVKRAYARLLRLHNPEDDAEGYQRLRAAFDSAIRLTRNRTDGAGFSPVAPVDDISLTRKSATETISDNPLFLSAETDEFIEEVTTLYGNFEARIQIENWQKLLRKDCLYSIAGRASAEQGLLRFLMRFRYLPCAVYRLLDDCFGWSGREIELIERYPEPFVNDLLNRIAGPEYLRYDLLIAPGASVIDPERYLEERESAYFEWRGSRFEDALPHIETAMALFKADPELLHMACDCYRAAEDHKRALAVGLRLANLLPQQPERYYDIAALMLEAGQAGQALAACRRYLDAYPKDFDGLCLAGRCCIAAADKGATAYFEQAARLRPLDLEPVIYLSSLYQRKLRALWRSMLLHPIDSLRERKTILQKRKSLPPPLLWAARHPVGVNLCRLLAFPLLAAAIIVGIAFGGSTYGWMYAVLAFIVSLGINQRNKRKKKGT